MEKLISEYKADLKHLRRQHQLIANKKNERTSIEKHDQRIIAEMISSTQYSLFWIQHGYEKPYANDSLSSLAKVKRVQLWGDMDDFIRWRNQKSQGQLAFESEEKRTKAQYKKEAQLEQLGEITSCFSKRELELFYLKYQALLNDAEIADKMEISPGTIKPMMRRIKKKIHRYFNDGHQMSLF